MDFFDSIIEKIDSKKGTVDKTNYFKIIGIIDLRNTLLKLKGSIDFKNKIKKSFLLIDLSHKEYQNFTNTDGIFQNKDEMIIDALLPLKETHDYHNHKFQNIPNELFHLIKLNTPFALSLSNNELSVLPEWMAIPKVMKRCTALDLSYNKLIKYPDWIKDCNNLLKLSLRNNNITHIDKNIFLENKHLSYLDLSFNKLKKADFYLFNLRKLQHFDLSYNEIEESMPSDFFRGNYRLKSAHFEYYGYELFNINFQYTPNIENLSIGGLDIGNILESGLGKYIKKGLKGAIKCLKEEYEIELLKNQNFVEQIHCSTYDFFSEISLYNLKKLKSLNLESNELKVFPKEFFELQSLQMLFLGDNLFSQEEKNYITNRFPKIDYISW